MTDKAERERQNARRRELRKEKQAAKVARENKLFELGHDALNGIFKDKEITLSILAAVLGAGASYPFKLVSVSPRGWEPADKDRPTTRWYSYWVFDSMSQKILSQTKMDVSVLGLKTGGGLQTMTGLFDTSWTGTNPDSVDPLQRQAVIDAEYAKGQAQATAYIIGGGAMAGFMGYQTIRLLAVILGSMLKQDLIPTP